MPFLSVQDVSAVLLVSMIVGAALCLLSYILRLAAHVSRYRKGAVRLDSRFLPVLIFVGYFGWGYWCGADPVKMNIPSSVSVPAGVALAVTGIGLFLYSEMKKHGVGAQEDLVTDGIYSKIRHPMYIGLVLLHIGFPFIFKSFIACMSTILWAAFIAVWTYYEEKNLERRFGRKYIDYRRQTWF
jgi:protein-S-isoprenylcysteine O-methyltransferase Ste14